MSRLREAVARATQFLSRRRHADEDELRFHVDMLEADLARRGLDPREAHRQARIAFGGLRQAAEALDDQRSLPFLDTLARDIAYGARVLRRAPGFTAVALLTLALGFGANIAVFGLVEAALLRPLPYRDPGRLVQVAERTANGGSGNLGFATIEDLRRGASSLTDIAAIRSWAPAVVVDGQAQRLDAVRVGASFFSLLGVQPALGRDFRADDDRPGRWRVLIVTDRLWRERFGGRPDVIGRPVRMNDEDYRIVGVLPPDFEPLISGFFYRPAEAFAPLGYDVAEPGSCRSCRHLKAIARLAPGVTADAATADLTRIRDRLSTEVRGDYAPGRIVAAPLHEVFSAGIRRPLAVLMAAVVALMLMACANVSGLLLARALGRRHEVAIRIALGASRARVVRQLVTEGLVLSALAALVGTAFGGLLTTVLPAVVPFALPRAVTPLPSPVIAFAAGLTVVAGLFFALAPALYVSARAAHGTALVSARTVAGGAGAWRRGLVVVTLALSLMLVSSAGLLLRSVAHLAGTSPGFDARGVVTLQLSLVGDTWREDAAVLAFQRRLLERVTAVPGVAGAALAGQLPMGGNLDRWGIHVASHPDDPGAAEAWVERYSVTPGYLDVLRVPVLRGRGITEADDERAERVALVSAAAAARYWPGRNPIDDQVRIGPPNGPPRTVVGIVGDVAHASLEAPAEPAIYVPQAQLTDSFLSLVVRASDSRIEGLLPTLRGVVRDLDATVPVYDAAPLTDLVARSFADRRAIRTLLTCFAALALLLAAVGLYGVAAFSVFQRRREIGVRLALGAGRGEIVRLIVGSGARTLVAGVALGAGGALVLAPSLRALLYEVPPSDPLTLSISVAALCTVGALAYWLPTLTALRVDPVTVLRVE